MYVCIMVEILIYVSVLIKGWFHVIMMLMLMEFISVKSFFLVGASSMNYYSASILFFFSVLMVCEASLGMGLLVGLSRGRGSEVIQI